MKSVAELEEALAVPSAGLVEDIARLDGDIPVPAASVAPASRVSRSMACETRQVRLARARAAHLVHQHLSAAAGLPLLGKPTGFQSREDKF